MIKAWEKHMPFGFGKGGGRGRGGGKGNGRLGKGRRFVNNRLENCICPSCGITTHHQRGVPCFQTKCPSCGSPMTRQFGTTVTLGISNQTSPKRTIPMIDANLCTGCEKCLEVCAVDAISMINEKAIINETICNGCRACVPACPKSAIK
jgi:Na+-translocating ferredoxin:NAD+ oxidoreductase subunit B